MLKKYQNKILVVLIGLNLFFINISYSQSNYDKEIQKNRVIAFQNTSTQVPYIFFEIRDLKGTSIYCVTFPGYEIRHHGPVKENEMIIEVNNINLLGENIKYVLVDKEILTKSPFFKLKREQLIHKYFLNGSIKDEHSDLAESNEFIFWLLKNGIFVRSGCESSLELYIGRPG